MNVELIEAEIDEITEKYKLKPSELALAVDLKPNTILKGDLYMLDLLNQIKEKKKKEIQILLTKSESIISKLKEIKVKAIQAKDTQSIEDIEWIISSINDQHLYELDTKDINSKIQADTNKSGLEYLMQYSRIEDTKQKEKDFNAARKSFKPSKSLRVGSLALNKPKKKSRFGNEERDKILKMINNADFNIFELDAIENGKGPISIAFGILNELDLIKKGIVPNIIIKDFVIKITEEYSRKNALYHNDLHAADVMQTFYTIFVQGNLMKVIIYHYMTYN